MGAHSNDPTQATLRSTEFWLQRLFPLRVVVVVTIVAIVAALIAVFFGASALVAAGIAVVVLAVGLVRLHGVTLVGAIVRPVRFAWYRSRRESRDPGGQPFDVPLPEGGRYGLRWDGSKLIVTLRIEARPQTMTLLSPGSLITDEVIPLPEIARCLTQFDITLDSIDVISNGSRAHSNSEVARIYDQILGPLPATAQRTVWLVLRLDPLANAAAVQRRGGGSVGALKTAIVAARRIANRLAERGLQVSVLSAAEMNDALQQVTGGVPLDDVEETWRDNEFGEFRMTSFEVGVDLLDAQGLTKIWTMSSLATTLTLRLRRGHVDGEIAVSAYVRFDTMGEIEGVPIDGLSPLHGKQHQALLSSLPTGGHEEQAGAREHFGPPEALAGLALPAAGCGQLIGADQYGRGVAVPLVGSRIRRVELIGNLHLAQQVILRAIALGANVLVHTNRHEAWRSMVTRVDSPEALHLATWNAASQQAGTAQSATVVVYDGVDVSGHVSDATIMRLNPPGTDTRFLEADVTLVQARYAASQVSVRTDMGTVATTMVATPDEMRYIGGSLDVGERGPVRV
ncbi:type VII secretion protein EccE [Antrihabitans stalagmiti]|uniref:type VII secretion protein EccE n=1 Tax=Antrihabitans stalagmiti TaxID=2799499 RepID=UPI0027DE7DA0|nr:type VII secretion protein EccE [Antrihabitans stalagmiti]